jgi:hypothetical protein
VVKVNRKTAISTVFFGISAVFACFCPISAGFFPFGPPARIALLAKGATAEAGY